MSFIGDIFTKKEKSVLGIDIGSSSLKVVQLRKDHGKAVLETYGELALGPYGGKEVGQATNLAAEQIVETLKDLLREAKVTTNSCGVSIPFARSLLTLVSLPYRKNPDEQKTIIELEARKYIPVPVAEVQLDWFVVPEAGPSDIDSGDASAKNDKNEKKEKIDVLLVAVHNDELALLQSIIAGAGLFASFYEIEIFSTIRAVIEDPIKPTMIIDVGAASTKTYVIEHGIVAFSHSISAGSQDITRAIAVSGNVSIAEAEALKKEKGIDGDEPLNSPELVFSRIFAEARRVLTQYETMHKKSVTSIVLTGGGGVTKELGAYAKNIFSIDVHVADPFSKTKAPAFMRSVLEDIGPEFAVAVGLALRNSTKYKLKMFCTDAAHHTARMPYTKRNYMPPTMPTSFVPHSASNEPRKFRADFGGLFSVASYIVFVIVFGLAIGVFFYGRILATNQSAKDATLSKVESSIDPSTVTNFVRLRDRLTASETLLANHIAFSGFFTLFGTLVPTTVVLIHCISPLTTMGR